MTFTFDMNSDDFMLPALSIQPIVENAIKHGLMPLDHGGSVRVTSWETPSDYCVSIEDDGAGFDTNILLDERKHIGLQNIRKRLEAMVGGSLTIESTIGKGTKVQLSIPKANI
jgi:sensor histidine kinase YesM